MDVIYLDFAKVFDKVPHKGAASEDELVSELWLNFFGCFCPSCPYRQKFKILIMLSSKCPCFQRFYENLVVI